MPKSIHERVRAAQEKRERDAQRTVRSQQERKAQATERKALREEQRLEALISGQVEPRNAKEQAIVDRMDFGDYSDTL